MTRGICGISSAIFPFLGGDSKNDTEVECHFLSLKSHLLISFSRSLLPRFSEKRHIAFEVSFLESQISCFDLILWVSFAMVQ